VVTSWTVSSTSGAVTEVAVTTVLSAKPAAADKGTVTTTSTGALAPGPSPMGPASATVPAQTGAPPLDTMDQDPRVNGPAMIPPEVNREDARTDMARPEINREDSRTEMESPEINREDSRTDTERLEINGDDAVTAPAEGSVP